MKITERIHRFAGELTHRKLSLNNRIEILKINQGENAQRIEQLEAVKKNIEELQETFFDFFYNELTGQDEPEVKRLQTGSVGERSNVVNLDQSMQEEEPQKTEAGHLINLETVIEPISEFKPGRKSDTDLNRLLGNIKNIQDKHRNE